MRSPIRHTCSLRSKSLSQRCFVTSFIWRSTGPGSTPLSSLALSSRWKAPGRRCYKGTLRIGGCVIGGALALFTIVFLMPHMETIASLIVVVACASAIAGWVATGSRTHHLCRFTDRVRFLLSASSRAMRPTQISITSAIASLEFSSASPLPLVFHYIWPEREADQANKLLLT